MEEMHQNLFEQPPENWKWLVPHQWKSAIITPISKFANRKRTSPPNAFFPNTDLFPSRRFHHARKKSKQSTNLSILSCSHHHQNFTLQMHLPTGRLVQPLPVIALLHIIKSMLYENLFVHVYALNFSKAVDTIRHSTLLEKLAKLNQTRYTIGSTTSLRTTLTAQHLPVSFEHLGILQQVSYNASQ